MSARAATVTVMLYRLASEHEAHLRLREALAQAGATGRLMRNAGGKPELAGGNLQFSFAHRGPWCAVATSCDCAVGVDLEVLQPLEDFDSIVSNFFPPVAQREWAITNPEDRLPFFFRWWTCIEAAGKAYGVGLDKAKHCLPQVKVESLDRLPQLAISVAARTQDEMRVQWNVSACL